MKTLKYITLVVTLCALSVTGACGGERLSESDIDATAVAIAKVIVAQTAQAAPTATPVPPTATPIPPTATPVPPTATPVPPTATPVVMGERLDYFNNSVYYLDSVTREEAQTLLDYLTDAGFWDTGSAIDVQLRWENGVYEMRMPLKEGINPDDDNMVELFTASTCELEHIVFGDSSNLVTTGDSFEDITKRFICLDYSGVTGAGERLDYFNNSVYYLDSVIYEEAQALLDHFIEVEFFTSQTSSDVQLRWENGAYEVRMVIIEGVDTSDPSVAEIFTEAACDMEAFVFPGYYVDWVLSTDQFDPIKRFRCY